MEKPTNIFYKIFQIMDRYEELLGNYATHENNYKEDDTFFTFLFNYVNKSCDIEKSNNDLSNNNTTEVKKNLEPPPTTESDENLKSEKNNVKSENDDIKEDNNKPAKPLPAHEEMINKYIKKCYKIIVLKCHPDKAHDSANSNELFIKCHEYMENNLLIGLLYIFYLYKLNPPKPIGESNPDSDILIQRILKEIRLIQDKVHNLDQKTNNKQK